MIRIGWSVAKRKDRYISLHCVLLHDDGGVGVGVGAGVGAVSVVDVVDFDGHRA